jgi:hypothetical protein
LSTEKKYYARRPIGYGGREYDRGQVLNLEGLRNDEKLVRLGHVSELRHDQYTTQCGVCSAWFVGDAELNGHGAARHSDRFASRESRLREALLSLEDEPDAERRRDKREDILRQFASMQDQNADREQKILEETAPLYLDKTAASLAEGAKGEGFKALKPDGPKRSAAKKATSGKAAGKGASRKAKAKAAVNKPS